MFGSTTKVECGKVYYNDSTNNVISPSQDSTNRQKAVEALHTIGSTKYDTLKDFGGDRTITREQAAKFFVSVNSKINPGATTVNGSCTFSDAAQADSTLTSSIMLACQQGIMM